MNYAPYLGAIRGEYVRAAARSIGAALIEKPVWWFRHSAGEQNGREVMCVSGTGQAIANHPKIASNNHTCRQMAKAPDTRGLS